MRFNVSRSTGKERDAESGNDYMFARYYNSATGRFLSPDWSAKEEPVPYSKLDDPQTLNLYSYVRNNPVGLADNDGHEIIYANGLQNAQVVRDTVSAMLADPHTSGSLSGYVGANSPNLTIQSGDLGGPSVQTLPNGQTLTTQVQANTVPDISTSTSTSTFDGVTSPPVTTTTMRGATITIDTRTSAGDTPGVMVHEGVHAGEALANPAQFSKDAKAEAGLPHDQRPQEERAISAQKAFGPEIKKAVKQMEKDRKKDEQ
jgi:RHS repeat-associated protein